MTISLQKGLREFKGDLSNCWCHCFDGSIWKNGIKMFPSEAERLEATKNMTPEEVDTYYKHLQEEQINMLRDLTDEEAEIVNNQLESESIETGVKLF